VRESDEGLGARRGGASISLRRCTKACSSFFTCRCLPPRAQPALTGPARPRSQRWRRGVSCPVSTGGGTRRVRLVREEGRGVSSQYGREEGGGVAVQRWRRRHAQGLVVCARGGGQRCVKRGSRLAPHDAARSRAHLSSCGERERERERERAPVFVEPVLLVSERILADRDAVEHCQRRLLRTGRTDRAPLRRPPASRRLDGKVGGTRRCGAFFICLRRQIKNAKMLDK